MAELVDAADSKSALSNRVLVQVRLEVPNSTTTDLQVVFLFPIVFYGIIWYDNKNEGKIHVYFLCEQARRNQRVK